MRGAAHACGATYRGRRIGAQGLTCFSFHAVKNLAIGDGGMITCDNDAIADRLRRLRWMGIDRSTFARNGGRSYQWEYAVDEVGFKYHMNDIAAAIGLAQLPTLDAGNARRAAICAAYRTGLADLPRERLAFIDQTAGATSANHICAVLVANRDQVADRLRAAGIGTGVHYKPNHLYPPYQQARRGSLVQTEAAFARLLSLPLHLMLTDADVARVIAAVRLAVTA
ncbi:MAG: DegT/DnrJ/EryC1/StrS family aminotransferase [Planctomycetota bacterium]